jgi:hypothetical protein
MADGDRLVLAPKSAARFTLAFLGAHPAGDRREGVVVQQGTSGALQVAICQPGDELRDVDHDRAAGDAGCNPATQATPGFGPRQLVVEAEVHLAEAAGPLGWSPGRHLMALDG